MSAALPPDELPKPEIRRDGRKRLSLIWLVPLIAALVGLGLVVRTWLNTGTTITISFKTAEGLENGKTEVRYKDVVVGKVRSISLNGDDSGVLIGVELTPEATRLAVKDSRFWVVRPRIGIGGVTGISTLLSGAYIGVDVGRDKEEQRAFEGLEKPPAVTHDQKGKQFTLTTYDASSITIGAPVYFRRVAVGQVVDSALDEDGKKITVKVFVEAPYDRFVTRNARFWNAGGVDLAVSSEGLRLNTQSLATVLAGGIAFQAPDPNNPGEAAPADQSFELFAKISDALAAVDGPSVDALLVLRQSTRGLSVGTPVDFSGVVIGEVKSMQPQYDSAKQSFYTNVMVELFLERLGPAYKTLTALDNGEGRPPLKVLQRFINQGLHAQLRAGNLLTGQQYIALFFKPGSVKKISIPPDSTPEIPTAPGSLEEIQTQIESIVTKFDKIPFEALAADLRSTLNNASSLLKTLDQEVAPQAKKTLADAGAAIQSLNQNLTSPEAPLQQDARRTLEQLNRTAASLRTLTEYLEQHPEALLRGRPVELDPQPQPSAGAAPDAPRN
ncbi:intermembrane transport protein PqiB [Nevskia ramosa]|uniref:PqiB family protein n=1 Tax=Nevskia ramosa TaxID=64002 RepID=UPI002357510E|nr:MlaD family protein [Nevskia ramosa]